MLWMAKKSAYVSIGKVQPVHFRPITPIPRCIQISGTTRINTRRHGTLFLCTCRYGEGIFRYLRQYVSWGGEGHEQKSGDEDSQGAKHCPGIEGKRDTRPRRQPCHT